MSESVKVRGLTLEQALPRYEAPWWLPGGHLQTLWRKLGPTPLLARQRQRISLEDGDFIDIDWAKPVSDNDSPGDCKAEEKPLVLVLHGLCGCSSSPYVLAMQETLSQAGLESAAMNLRGCSGEPNRLARAYHSGCSEDVEAVLQEIHAGRPLILIGYSLGANVMIKWLAETSLQGQVRTAVAVSNPFSLAHCCEVMVSGRVSRYYGHYFLRRLVNTLEEKKQWFAQHGMSAALADLEAVGDVQRLQNIWEFDENVTAPLHGFASARDYYDRCSSAQFLSGITVPTLIIHGYNDPIIPPSGLPDRKQTPTNIHWDIHPRGGHVGFAAKGQPGWLEVRILRYIELTNC